MPRQRASMTRALESFTSSAAPSRGPEARTREAYISGHDADDPAPGISVRCLRAAGHTTGAIGFEGLANPEPEAGALAALATTLLERTRAFRRASLSAATAQTEAYRSAILDVLAHEFKNPLATILAAAGGLREACPLRPEHEELAEMVETEAAQLGYLTSRLLRVARLDREEVKPRMELIDIMSLVSRTIQAYSRHSSDRPVSLQQGCESAEVVADPELLRLAVSQLVDNACNAPVMRRWPWRSSTRSTWFSWTSTCLGSPDSRPAGEFEPSRHAPGSSW